MGDIIDQVASIAVPAVLTLAGQPELAAIYSGVTTGVKTGSPLAGLGAAGGSYFGGQLGSSLGQGAAEASGGLLSQTPSNALSGLIGGEAVGSIAPFGSWAGNALGSATIGSMAGGAFGSSIGQDLGTQLGQSIMPGGGEQLSAPQGPAAFQASRSPQMGLPQSLSQFGNLDPLQQATNIASKGVYGGGQGKDENSYFLNLINRQLVDPNGNVGGMQSVNPVEMGYLSQLGLGGYNNSNDLLKGISQYQG